MDLSGFFPSKNGGNHPQNKNTSTPFPSGIPMVNQVMSVVSGATNAFSGVARHVNTSLKKIGPKNMEAGIGFGPAWKPRVVPRIQMQIMEAMTKLMIKIGGGPNLSLGQGALPEPLQRGMNVLRETSQKSAGSIIPDMMRGNMVGDKTISTKISSSASNGASLNLSTSSRSEKLVNSVLKDLVLQGEDTNLSRKNGKLQSEDEVLRMVLKHQQVIEELIKENKTIRQVLVEDLKVPSTKLQTTSSAKLKSSYSDCFDCPRKESKK